MHGLAYWELGFRQMTNSKHPLTKVEDIAGLKLRVIPNAINVDWVKALGANPTPMSFPEVYGGLEAKPSMDRKTRSPSSTRTSSTKSRSISRSPTTNTTRRP